MYGTSKAQHRLHPPALHAENKPLAPLACQLAPSYRCLPSDSVLIVHHDLSFAVGALQVDGVPHVQLDCFLTPALHRHSVESYVRGHRLFKNTLPCSVRPLTCIRFKCHFMGLYSCCLVYNYSPKLDDANLMVAGPFPRS